MKIPALDNKKAIMVWKISALCLVIIPFAILFFFYIRTILTSSTSVNWIGYSLCFLMVIFFDLPFLAIAFYIYMNLIKKAKYFEKEIPNKLDHKLISLSDEWVKAKYFEKTVTKKGVYYRRKDENYDSWRKKSYIAMALGGFRYLAIAMATGTNYDWDHFIIKLERIQNGTRVSCYFYLGRRMIDPSRASKNLTSNNISKYNMFLIEYMQAIGHPVGQNIQSARPTADQFKLH